MHIVFIVSPPCYYHFSLCSEHIRFFFDEGNSSIVKSAVVHFILFSHCEILFCI